MPKHVTDLMNIEGQLSASELEVRDRVADFVDRRVRPNIGTWFDEAVLPTELLPDMAELGLFGMHLEGYGCAGKSATEYGIAMQEMEAGDSGLRTVISVQGSLAMSAIYKNGSEEQKQTWLPRMASGEVIGCFGLTEPTAVQTLPPWPPAQCGVTGRGSSPAPSAGSGWLRLPMWRSSGPKSPTTTRAPPVRWMNPPSRRV